MDIREADAGCIEAQENFVWSFGERETGSDIFDLDVRIALPGSGTGTSSMVTLKSGPGFDTTPALQVVGIMGASKVCNFPGRSTAGDAIVF